MLDKLNIPVSVIETIDTLPESVAAMMYLAVMNYAFKGVEPQPFASPEQQAVFDNCRKILDPVIRRRAKSIERAEQRKQEKARDPEGYARRQKERKLKAISTIKTKDMDFRTVTILAHALIKDKQLRHEYLIEAYKMYRRRKGSPVMCRFDLSHDAGGNYSFMITDQGNEKARATRQSAP